MAFAARFLSRSASRQLYGGKTLVQPEQMILARSYAQGPQLKGKPPKKDLGKLFQKEIEAGDKMLKDIFVKMVTRFQLALDVFKKEKITIDPEDPAAVAHYAKLMKMAREKSGSPSFVQQIQNKVHSHTQNIPDARTHLLALQELRTKMRLKDNFGLEKLRMEALEKVEKELKKPLMRNDKEGMARLNVEFDKINQKLGIKKEDLPKHAEELELIVAKEQLKGMEKEILETMENYKKREEFKNEEIPSVKSLDIRNFLGK